MRIQEQDILKRKVSCGIWEQKLHEMRRGLKNTEQEMGECTESGILLIKELESLSSVLR